MHELNTASYKFSSQIPHFIKKIPCKKLFL